MLFLTLIAVPLLGAIVTLIKRDSKANISLLVSAIVLVVGIVGFKDVFTGTPATFEMALPGPFAPTFQADPLTAIFVILTCFVWLAVSMYTPKYMKHEGGEKRFKLCALLTLSSILGVFTSGDLFTLLLFFEIMTVTSYFWVIHKWDNDAISAGYYYLFYSIIGGLLVVLGAVLLYSASDSTLVIGESVTVTDSRMFAWAIGLLIAGFGTKAGMFPLHSWLPRAHSAAPTPGSALLSGLIIKVGIYGLIRSVQFVGWGNALEIGTSRLGPALAVLGVCTMLVGTVLALFQSHAKRLLAYSSVSQMGYIILGLGTSLYLGQDGGLGLLGAIYHVVNHALFKATLFMGIGIIYIKTNELDLYKMGGLLRRFPITAALMFVAVLGIIGAPGLNGYVSKTVLHHGVTLAAETGAGWAIWAERLFLVTGVGTATYFAKLYYLIFLKGSEKATCKSTDIRTEKASSANQVQHGEKEVRHGKSTGMHIGMGILVVTMLVIGISPKLFPDVSGAVATQGLGINNAIESLGALTYWNFSDISGMVITLALGVFFCWLGLKSGLFSLRLPVWISTKCISSSVQRLVSAISKRGARFYSSASKLVSKVSRSAHSRLFNYSKSRAFTIFETKVAGIGADATLLIVVLTLLIVWYTLIDPGLPVLEYMKLVS